MEDFIVVYTYPYKGRMEERSTKYTGIDDRGVAYAMADFLSNIEGSMVFSGIDYKGVEDYIKENKGNSLGETLSKINQKEVSEFSNHDELKDVAFSYALYYSLKIHGERAFPSKEEITNVSSSLKEEKFAKKKGIGFMLRYGELIIIKKLSYEDVEDYMVAGIIAGISDSISKRIYSFLGFEEVRKKKKSLKGLAESLKNLNGEGVERRFNTYRAIIENGYSPYATLEMLAKKYKDLKPKKPKGRLPK